MPELTPGGLALVLTILFIAGLVAGVLNSVVGSGSLITFPVLVILGVPPVPATLTGSVGLVLSNFTGPWGYRRMLAEQGARLRLLLPPVVLGGLTGSLLLTALPSVVFATLAPALILVAVVLVIAQPWLQRLLRTRSSEGPVPELPGTRRRILTLVLVYLAAVYGGYFVSAQGVFMFGVVGAMLGGDVRYVNALKNALSSLVNVISATVYTITAFDRIIWIYTAAIALGAGIGGLLGVRVARRVPGAALRWMIAAIGIAGLIALLVRPAA